VKFAARVDKPTVQMQHAREIGDVWLRHRNMGVGRNGCMMPVKPRPLEKSVKVGREKPATPFSIPRQFQKREMI
jgi:hypothetical protein